MKKLLVLLMVSFSSIGGLMFLQQEGGQKELDNRGVSTTVIEDANNICDCRQL